MSANVSFKKEIMTPQVAKIHFVQPQRKDQHITDEEIKERIAENTQHETEAK